MVPSGRPVPHPKKSKDSKRGRTLTFITMRVPPRSAGTLRVFPQPRLLGYTEPHETVLNPTTMVDPK